MNYHVYILQSIKDKKYYIGCTSKQPLYRLKEHNSGMVTSTKNRRPFKLIWFQSFTNKKTAFKKEWFLKHPAGYQEKLQIIREYTGQ